MRKTALTRLLPWVMFGASFVLLAAAYRGLPSEFPVLRVWIRHTTLWASKSPITVFRVPFMNLTHGLMAAVMLSRTEDFGDLARRTSYSNLFSTLLLTVALKSDFEAMEFGALAAPGSLGFFAPWLGFGTLASVVGGICLALFQGRKGWIPWPELRLANRNKIFLVGLFLAYLALAILPLLASHGRSPNN